MADAPYSNETLSVLANNLISAAERTLTIEEFNETYIEPSVKRIAKNKRDRWVRRFAPGALAMWDDDRFLGKSNG